MSLRFYVIGIAVIVVGVPALAYGLLKLVALT